MLIFEKPSAIAQGLLFSCCNETSVSVSAFESLLEEKGKVVAELYA